MLAFGFAFAVLAAVLAFAFALAIALASLAFAAFPIDGIEAVKGNTCAPVGLAESRVLGSSLLLGRPLVARLGLAPLHPGFVILFGRGKTRRPFYEVPNSRSTS